jgi:hypothetical protein
LNPQVTNFSANDKHPGRVDNGKSKSFRRRLKTTARKQVEQIEPVEERYGQEE